eukprot:4621888-Alexandrium_andersonii.AAC.1
MSASLVGSEMCIRDRGPVDPERRGVVALGEVLQGDAVDRLRREDVEPVSYTHLTLPTICSV